METMTMGVRGEIGPRRAKSWLTPHRSMPSRKPKYTEAATSNPTSAPRSAC